MTVMPPPPVHALPRLPSSRRASLTTKGASFVVTERALPQRLDAFNDFYTEATAAFADPLHVDILRSVSTKLHRQFRDKMRDSDICMLPSYNHTLPAGHERGDYLALDVGGSTFRAALVRLKGFTPAGKQRVELLRQTVIKIDDRVRALEGPAFFDWLARGISQILAVDDKHRPASCAPLRTGLAWSFPLEQTSIDKANLLRMGKGFQATRGVMGHCLADLVTQACRRKKLNIQLDAIVNDSSATLLSSAYKANSTRLAFILGTGLNAAVHLPCSVMGRDKFASRPRSWHDDADHVMVNSELSMFGKGAIPTTRWDDLLNISHASPDFQPLEYLTGGRYLGEIVRILVSEAAIRGALFDGAMPSNFQPYSLSSETIAIIEADDTPTLTRAADILSKRHPLRGSRSYSGTDIANVRKLIKLVSDRAAAYLATSVYSLWLLQHESEGASASAPAQSSIGCSGSIIEKYPAFRERVQSWLNRLSGSSTMLKLEQAEDSSTLIGAAVAVSCHGNA